MPTCRTGRCITRNAASAMPRRGCCCTRPRPAAGGPPIDAGEKTPDGAPLSALWRQRRGFYPPQRPELLQAFVLDALKVTGDVEAGHRAVASYCMEDRIAAV